MAIKIGSNIASLQAQRRLGEATSALSSIYEKLSSGQRINKASDDAAGLAIASDLNAQSRVFGQAIRNINDGVSIYTIADSAVESLTGINIRLKELASQSANGVYSTKQREALDNEAQALKDEYFRVSRSTQFNGQRLFDGSMSTGLRLQLGYGIEGSIHSSIGGKLGDGSISLAMTLSGESGVSSAIKVADLNGDGLLDLVTAGFNDSNDGYATVRLGNGAGGFGAATSYTTESRSSSALALRDLDGDGVLDLVTAGRSDGNDGYATVRFGNGAGGFGAATSYTTETRASSELALGDLNGDGALDLVTAGYTDSSDGYATVRLGNGTGGFGAATSFAMESSPSFGLSLGDLNGDGVLDIVTAGLSDSFDGYATVRLGNGAGGFGAATSFATESRGSTALSLGDLNKDGFLDIVTAGFSDGFDGYATVRLGNGAGGFGAATSYSTESNTSNGLSLGDLNGDGVLDIVTTGYSSSYDGYYTVRLGNGVGGFGGAVSQLAIPRLGSNISTGFALTQGDIDGDGVIDILLAGQFNSSGINTDGTVAILRGNSRDGISPLESFSLRTKADALQAIGLFSRNSRNLLEIRGNLGATQSRLSAALSAISTQRENYIGASSRITNADIAGESANLTRTQILQEAASAVLAQAKQAPALALTLLR